MKMSTLEGQSLIVKIGAAKEMTATLLEIRPVGFLFRVTECDSGDYQVGQYVFLSPAYPMVVKTHA
jgi:hypothetical protein